MLSEFPDPTALPDGSLRRWFSDANMDLIVWQAGKTIVAFQLCYNKSVDEHAVVWRVGEPVRHYKVDPGEPGPLKNLSPLMVQDGQVDVARLQKEFSQRAAAVDRDIVDLVGSTLDQLV